ncbi:MAG: hypothetical protein LBJ23_00365 [Tannerella sp.]|jgi:hypothetical protein|nr:hypothetical protein [Tannerella sp.]
MKLKTARLNGITKIFLLLCLTLSVHGAFSQIRIQSGLILSGGASQYYDYRKNAAFTTDKWVYLLDGNKKFDAAIGYKFRLLPAEKPFFVDLDVQAGYGQLKYGSWSGDLYAQPGMEPAIWENITANCFRLSFNPTFNYKVYGGLYAGLGVEPSASLTFKSGDASNSFSTFDVPLTARAGYDFKYADVSFNYKYGFLDVMDTDYFSSGKVRRWQIQVFIPF